MRLVLADGDMAGVVSKEEAIERAFEAGLDLVAISPNADPPDDRGKRGGSPPPVYT